MMIRTDSRDRTLQSFLRRPSNDVNSTLDAMDVETQPQTNPGGPSIATVSTSAAPRSTVQTTIQLPQHSSSAKRPRPEDAMVDDFEEPMMPQVLEFQ